MVAEHDVVQPGIGDADQCLAPLGGRERTARYRRNRRSDADTAREALGRSVL
ncbi:MAG TPA: hypothetical protein VFB74_04550 [Kribbellaceae bacterium]|nr:hypothetical protein [Kribbellaceae bacterium]